MPDSEAAAIDEVLSAAAVRERCREILEAGLAGRLQAFTVHPERLDAVAELVLSVTRESYPDGQVPVHSRWRHFETAHGALWRPLFERRQWLLPLDRLRAEIDLAVISVLLDAGAGDAWRYRDWVHGDIYARSEGLAVASLRMFADGLFSSDAGDPLRCDGPALRALTPAALEGGFQVTAENPLVGLQGRLLLLHNLGRVLGEQRPSVLLDDLGIVGGATAVSASDLLRSVLRRLNEIWPGRLTIGGVNLGDVWRHEAIRRSDATSGLVPFHKLSQWLTYSLIEPLERGGVAVTTLDGLTGLAEYRNGGLFLDMGAIACRNPKDADNAHRPDSPLVVEWRALTVALLDEIAGRIRQQTGEPDAWPLARVLQGGSWTAGRRLAQERRPGGTPPIRIESDGTVF